MTASLPAVGHVSAPPATLCMYHFSLLPSDSIHVHAPAAPSPMKQKGPGGPTCTTQELEPVDDEQNPFRSHVGWFCSDPPRPLNPLQNQPLESDVSAWCRTDR